MKTLVYGASTNPKRYAYTAINRLRHYGYEVIAIGLKAGLVGDVELLTGHPALEDIHTISLYLSPARQSDQIEYLLSLSPQRIIFNPGTENPEFAKRAAAAGITVTEACTLVLLSTGQYAPPEDEVAALS